MRGLRTGTALFAAAVIAGCAKRPVPQNDSVVALRGTPLDIDVLKNDTDPRSRPLVVGRAWGAVKGSVSINSDGTVRYTPRADASGEDTFHYRVKNNRGAGRAGSVHVKIVEPLGDAVLATPAEPPAKAKQIVTQELAAPVNSAAFIQSLAITFFTREDDKDQNEPVTVIVRRKDETLAERSVGAGEIWEAKTDHTEELALSRAIPLDDAGSLSLEVRKAAAGPGPGGSWTVQLDVQGRLSTGEAVTVVPKTLPFRFGGGSSNNRSWKLITPQASTPH